MGRKYKKNKRLKRRVLKKYVGRPNVLMLSKPGQVIPRMAYAIFRSHFKIGVNGNTADATQGSVVVKLNSCVAPFAGCVIPTNINQISGFTSGSDASGYNNYVGTSSQLFQRCRVYSSNITVRTMGGLLGTAYNVCVFPVKAGATVGTTYRSFVAYPYSKCTKTYATIYQPCKISNTMSVARLFGTTHDAVMTDDLFLQTSSTVDPSNLGSWVIGWQTADGLQPSGGVTFEITIDHHCRLEIPNTEDFL